MQIQKINYHKAPKQSVIKNSFNRSFTSQNFPSDASTGDQFALATHDLKSLTPNWVKDLTIQKALHELSEIKFDPNDIKHVQELGANVPFKDGAQAVNFINKSNTRIKFDFLPSTNVHAQYDYENNFIIINQIYKNTQNPAEILAIAEAILHEAGHAADKDNENSLQEEINCLSLNAISHRALLKKYPGMFANADSLIVKDGVCVYAELFFDPDPEKRRLVERLKIKYGFLPAGDFSHPPSNLAIKVKST